MKKIIETVAEGGGELGVHMYPFSLLYDILRDFLQCKQLLPQGSKTGMQLGMEAVNGCLW